MIKELLETRIRPAVQVRAHTCTRVGPLSQAARIALPLLRAAAAAATATAALQVEWPAARIFVGCCSNQRNECDPRRRTAATLCSARGTPTLAWSRSK